MTDPLTGLLNRSQLQSTLENAIRQNHRTNAPMALIMIDIDHFKSINDSLGHEAGDAALTHLRDFPLAKSLICGYHRGLTKKSPLKSRVFFLPLSSAIFMPQTLDFF